jgi:hypothetical protein
VCTVIRYCPTAAVRAAPAGAGEASAGEARVGETSAGEASAGEAGAGEAGAGEVGAGVGALAGVVRGLDELQVTPEDLVLRRPTLDEAFLALTASEVSR